jgi:predicted ATPase
MEPMIQTLILKRFRSIVAETVHLDNPTFLVGRNGSGKSNFRDAIAFLAEAMVSPLHAVFDRRGGIAVVRNRTAVEGYPVNLGLGVEFGPIHGEMKGAHYAFEIRARKHNGFEVVREQCIVYPHQGVAYQFDRRGKRFRSNLSGLNPSVEPAALALPVVGGESRFAPVLKTLSAMRSYTIEPARLREWQDPENGSGLKSDGNNVARVLQEIRRRSRDDFERICEFLEAIVPNTKRVRPIKQGNKLALEFTQQWGEEKTIRFEAGSMSDGTLRALGLLTAVYQFPRPSLVIIEEPEATMHLEALPVITDLIRHASRFRQVVVTTHNPDVLDAEWIEGRHIRIVTWAEGATHITPVAKGTNEAIAEQLGRPGELLRSNALRAAPTGPHLGTQLDLFKDEAA